MFPHEIRHGFLPGPRRDASHRLVLRAGENAVNRPLRDEAFHLRERRRADRARLHWNAFRVAAIERPLRVLLPAAFARVSEMNDVVAGIADPGLRVFRTGITDAGY